MDRNRLDAIIKVKKLLDKDTTVYEDLIKTAKELGINYNNVIKMSVEELVAEINRKKYDI